MTAGQPPLVGRTALVTGVSRRRGIGFAVARRLLADGAAVMVHHFTAHDREQPWGADEVDELVEDLRREGTVFDVSADLAEASAATQVVDAAVARLGHLDILVCNHARSGRDGALRTLTAAELDTHWQVNARATLLLTRAFADQHDGRPGGRVVWMTSGQQLGPMRDEVAYAASKAALAGVTATVADELVDVGILLNTVNPGPVNTGYLDAPEGGDAGGLYELLARFPLGRFGAPEDPARLIAWLVSDEGAWMSGQVLSTEGGFRRA